MQRGADADHARPEHKNVGLQFRHPALRKFNVTPSRPPPKLKLAIAASRRKPARRIREIALARRLDFGHMGRQYPPQLRNWTDQSGEIQQMSVRLSLFAAATATMLALAPARGADPALRHPGRPQIARSLYAQRNLHARHLGHVYEGLTTRDKDLKIVPGLAERWEIAGADPLALSSAQGREIPQRRGLHRRRRGVLGRARPRQGLELQDPRRRPTPSS